MFRRQRTPLATRVRRSLSRAVSAVSSQRVLVSTPEGELKKMASSWIRKYDYNNETRVLTLITKDGRRYTWNGIDSDTAGKILRGDAIARTNDPSGRRRWWINKTPSLGAAYWTFLEGRRSTSRDMSIRRERRERRNRVNENGA